MRPFPDSTRIQGGRLEVGGVDLTGMAREHGTPVHVYCLQTLQARAGAYASALSGAGRAVFACKANGTVEVVRAILAQGLGADVASEGELAAALRAGAAPEWLVVHGNNKSDRDVEAALDAAAGLVVLDHPEEAAQVERLAASAGRVQQVLLRVTPGIVADTHRKIVTGHDDSKFGMAPPAVLDLLDEIAGMPYLQPAGLHVHLGSQISDLGAFRAAAAWLAGFVDDHGLGDLPLLDLGGGLAIPYLEDDDPPTVETAVAATLDAVVTAFLGRGLPLPQLILEPGRSIAGPAGVTLYTVGAIKTSAAGTIYAAVDGGMSDNPRPALYGARYTAAVSDRADAPGEARYTIAGKHCESGDILIEGIRLPQLRPGDVLAVPATGAYSASMASTYNALPRPAAVMVEAGAARLIVRRETVGELLARDLESA
ncbi:MAG TPA: diaminopimelate decarboxylase [Gaiellales bacterium]|nr:diaminopimelate decarboxylase [Gaiellales bacterium]